MLMLYRIAGRTGLINDAFPIRLSKWVGLLRVRCDKADPNGGYRELGSGGVVKDGVNPVFHPSMHKAGGDAAACEQHFKSYDPTTGTFLGEDGKRHPC
jgi:hypothetical protein